MITTTSSQPSNSRLIAAISPLASNIPTPNMQSNPEITQIPLSILSKHSLMINSAFGQHVSTYNLEKMSESKQSSTPLLEPKLASSDIHSSTNCYELFRFSLNSTKHATNQACKVRSSTSNSTTLTTCYSTSAYQNQQPHSIPNDLIHLATMTPETFKSSQSKLPIIRVQEVHSPIRTSHYYAPKFDHSPHLSSFHPVDSISSPSLISRSKIIGVVSTSRSSSVTDIHRKSPSFASESSSCKSPTRDDTPKASLSKIQKPKHATQKKRSSSSSSTDEEEGKKFNTGTWTRSEHEQFLKGLEEVGKNWKLISENYVQTRKRTQIASHAQKWFLKLAEMKKGGSDSSNHSSEELYL
ncbi:predicted protein [Naegleria gruberi]|uniref:Predicted protein n=1 Tax=Naegleria gruberi TaxID=5762 RepID=D2V9G3_NAEGR|nr:uncharacterized protein NAEGRDRAFT_57515 [Naegleria gruberi]EFC46587.1 predicted protein [Naegleria gruberi]|eukprot:XP_002679331.1 predicted protein [Naegleria gruberi strain NEG-M]